MPKKPSKKAPKRATPAKPPARAAKLSDPIFTPEQVQAISVAVYSDRIGPKAVAKLLADAGGASVLESRSIPYNAITRAYLRVLFNKGLLK